MLVKFIEDYNLNEIEFKRLFNDFLSEFVYPFIQENGLENLYLNHDNKEVFLPANDLYNIEAIKKYINNHENLLVFVNAQFKHDIDEDYENHPDNIELLIKRYTFWGLFKGNKCSFFEIDNSNFDESYIPIVSDYLYYTINYFDDHFIPSNFEPFFDISGYSFLYNSCYEFPFKHYQFFERINNNNVIAFLNKLLKEDLRNYEGENWKIPVNNSQKERFEINKFKDYFPNCKQANFEIPKFYNKHKYTIIIDTETNGLPDKFDTPFPYLNYPEIVQISWAVFDIYDRLIKVQNFIVKPDGYKISTASTKIHGIHHIQAQIGGVHFHTAISELYKDISICELIVGHNLEFDIKVIEAHCYKYYLKEKDWIYSNQEGFFHEFKKLEKFCTMKNSETILKDQNFSKWLKLGELYEFLFNDTISGLHSSLKDIWVTYKCFDELKWSNKSVFNLLIPFENSND